MKHVVMSGGLESEFKAKQFRATPCLSSPKGPNRDSWRYFMAFRARTCTHNTVSPDPPSRACARNLKPLFQSLLGYLSDAMHGSLLRVPPKDTQAVDSQSLRGGTPSCGNFMQSLRGTAVTPFFTVKGFGA